MRCGALFILCLVLMVSRLCVHAGLDHRHANGSCSGSATESVSRGARLCLRMFVLILSPCCRGLCDARVGLCFPLPRPHFFLSAWLCLILLAVAGQWRSKRRHHHTTAITDFSITDIAITDIAIITNSTTNIRRACVAHIALAAVPQKMCVRCPDAHHKGANPGTDSP